MKSENSCCRNDKNVNIISAKENEIQSLIKPVEKERREVAFWGKKFVNKQPPAFSAKLLNTDKKLRLASDYQIRQPLKSYSNCLRKKLQKYNTGKVQKSILHKIARIFQAYQKSPDLGGYCLSKMNMKLRLGSLNAALAVRFQISETTVSKVIHTWVPFLAKELNCLIYNPSKDIVCSTCLKSLTMQSTGALGTS